MCDFSPRYASSAFFPMVNFIGPVSLDTGKTNDPFKSCFYDKLGATRAVFNVDLSIPHYEGRTL